MEAWWSSEFENWIGIFGAGLGVFFGILGSIVGAYLVPRGYGRRWVLGGITTIVITAFTVMVAGMVAIVDNQPPRIYLVLLMFGSIFYCVPFSLFPSLDVSYHIVLKKIGEGAGCFYPKWSMASAGWRTIVALPNDWRPHGRFGKWRKPVIGLHGTVGLIVLVWSIWLLVFGSEKFDDDEWFMILTIGFTFCYSSLQAWKMFPFPGTSKVHEQIRLAAEELRRS